MNIGERIKNARMCRSMTQEEVADALGVSRQTISNWENGKTYPDIISVIKMSDLYMMSLDTLLKEKENMSDYYDYLKESTDSAESKRKLSQLLLILTYLLIWGLSIIVFWFFTDGSEAMGYSIMYLYIIMPVTTFVISFITGYRSYYKYIWVLPVLLGVMYMLGEYATFSASYMSYQHVFTLPEFPLFFIGFLISLSGLAIGNLIKHHK